MLSFLASSALAADPVAIPEDVWAEVVAGLGVAPDAVGYSATEMQNFGRDTWILPQVRGLFADVRHTLRFAIRTTDELADDVDRPDELLRQLYGLVGSSAGRMVPVPGLDADGTSGESPPTDARIAAEEPVVWGAGLPDGAAPTDALRALLEPPSKRDRREREAALQRFSALPEPVQRLVVRLTVASLQAGPWVAQAIAKNPARSMPLDDAYALLTAVRAETELPGFAATLEGRTFDAIGLTDLDTMAFASVLWSKHLRLALAEFDAAGGPATLTDAACREFGEIVLPTPGGPLVLTDGAGRTRSAAEAPMLVLDLGGDDTWVGRYGVSTPWPVSALVDLGGNDSYRPEGETKATLATGLLGVGAVVDRAGDDHYEAHESSLASAWHGTGLLLDHAGQDTYALTGLYGSAAAHVGVALLVDHTGDDSHTARGSSQAMGGPRGAALLLDVAGDDQYVIPDDADPSELYMGRTVAMSQGCGYGRRADFGDGHSLAGGIGLLVDLAGDDRYHAMAWSQGAAYWWGVGVLDDRSGNDTYRNGKYSLGAGAHFGIGIQLDHLGDDAYNTGLEHFVSPVTGRDLPVAEMQFQGHGRDGSLGLSLDLAGDDAYLLRTHSGGSGDLDSIGLFYEAQGNDRYRFLVPAPGDENAIWAETPPLGSTTHYPVPFRTFRDEMSTFGIFVDGGGQDLYESVDAVVVPDRGDGRTWTSRVSDRERGIGIDRP